MRHEKTRLLASVLAVVLCVAAFSVTAFASDDAWCEYGDYDTPEAPVSAGVTGAPVQTAKPTPTVKPEPELEPSSKPETPPREEDDTGNDGENGVEPLTPSGNLNLVDDVLQTDSTPDDASGGKKGDELEEKQFITVQSKNGNYFYIVIDRVGSKENVHFLNQVDEVDLFALMEDEPAEEKPPVCTCADKCMAGSINLSCPVCQTTMSECTGKEPVPEPSPEPDTEPEKETHKLGSTAPLLIVLALAMVGGVVYYFKLRKPKADTKGPVDLDDYDFGEDDEDDYEYEKDDDAEPEEKNK